MAGHAKSNAPLEISSLSAISHLLEHKPERLLRLRFNLAPAALKGRLSQLYDRAKEIGVGIDFVPAAGKPRTGHHDDVGPVQATVGAFRYAELREFLASLKPQNRALVVALDHLQDPQNFGALCRTAEGLGAQGILIPKDRSVSVTPGVYHASVGAVETIPVVQVQNLGEALRKMKEEGFWIVGSALAEQATPPSQMPDFEKKVLVLGAELEGMSPLIEKLCDWKVQIPLVGRVQSLNVSAAGAVLIYEMLRPRTQADQKRTL